MGAYLFIPGGDLLFKRIDVVYSFWKWCGALNNFSALLWHQLSKEWISFILHTSKCYWLLEFHFFCDLLQNMLFALPPISLSLWFIDYLSSVSLTPIIVTTQASVNALFWSWQILACSLTHCFSFVFLFCSYIFVHTYTHTYLSYLVTYFWNNCYIANVKWKTFQIIL